jgi:uncharacterized delta-60 repeat protein
MPGYIINPACYTKYDRCSVYNAKVGTGTAYTWRSVPFSFSFSDFFYPSNNSFSRHVYTMHPLNDFKCCCLTMRKLLALFLLTPGFAATAQPLALDPGFGNNGAAICYDSGRTNVAHDLAQQPDGKILAAGMTYANDGQLYYESFIARFLPNGSLDNSFGANGGVKLATGNQSAVQALRIQPDGKIVIVGNETVMIEQPGPPPSLQIFSRPFIARLKANGALDSSFAENGIHRLGILNGYLDKDLAAVALRTDGKIVAGGNVYTGEVFKMMVVSLNTDGTYDNSFGSSGMATYTLENGKDATLFDMALQTDGRLILAGSSGTLGLILPPEAKFGLARINTDGTPDVGFGNQGFVVNQISGGAMPFADIINEVRLQADGKIYVAGQSGSDLALGRYLTNGSPGFTLRNDRLYTCGSLQEADNSLKIKVAGFHTNGAADSTAGPDGVYTGDIYERNYTHAMLTQADGKLVVAGSFRGEDGKQGMLLIRFGNNAPTDVPSIKGKQTTIKLYPNPAHDALILENSKANGMTKEAVTIFNILGQVVYNGISKDPQTTISIDHLAAGNYLLRLSGNDGHQTLKFVKQ